MKAAMVSDMECGFIAHSYPVDQHQDCVVVECSPKGRRVLGNSFEENVLEGNTSKRNASKENLPEQNHPGYLSDQEISQFHQLFPMIRLQQNSPIRWRTTMINTCQRLTTGNAAFLGEAGISAHYSIGAGLLLAFQAADELAAALQQSASLPEALKKYDALLPSLQETQERSRRSMRWMETIDDIQALRPSMMINSYQMKSSFLFPE